MVKNKTYEKPKYGISPLQQELLNTIKESKMLVFNVSELKQITSSPENQLNKTLQKTGLITRIKKGTYCVTEDIPEHLYQLSTESFGPAYISFWTALSYYGFTEQQPIGVQIVITRVSRTHKIFATKFKSKRFFGYTKLHG